MTQAQSFKILPNGLVRGGRATYVIDLGTGNVYYSADIKVGFFTKSTHGVFQCELSLLRSSSVVEGAVIKIGSVTFKILSVAQEARVALVRMTVDSGSIEGSVRMDLSGEYVRVTALDGTASAWGMTLTIQATEEPTPPQPLRARRAA